MPGAHIQTGTGTATSAIVVVMIQRGLLRLAYEHLDRPTGFVFQQPERTPVPRGA